MLKRFGSIRTILFIFLTLLFILARYFQSPSSINAQAAEVGSWPMLAANPQRTSRSTEEVGGSLNVTWYKVFEPYISQKVQIIAANNTLFISTARGLYALDASSGSEKWVFPTELPLGHSPTYHNGVVYVGGLDRKLYAINASNGSKLWSFDGAQSGYVTNPLVINDKIYLGNRDGYFYAIYNNESPNKGSLDWKFKTDGPILFSAAYQNGVVFFASNDAHVYALKGETSNANGELVWKKKIIYSRGFHSWWPVIFEDRVLIAGSQPYRFNASPGPKVNIFNLQKQEIFPNYASDPRGTLIGQRGTEPGKWVSGTTTINAQRITNYYNDKPWRKTLFVLDKSNGQEREIAPFAYTGTYSGTRYPPIVGYDGVLYIHNVYKSDPSIPGGQVSGWKYGTSYISMLTGDWKAQDEPMAYSAGGKYIYYNLNCDRVSGRIDISKPLNSSGKDDGNYFCNQCGTSNAWLTTKAPGYRDMFWGMDRGWSQTQAEHWTAVFGNRNGIYGDHADQNPPIPYNGKLYLNRSNAIIALSPSGSANRLSNAKKVTVTNSDVLSKAIIEAKLEQEISKMINAGHLRPGYVSTGFYDWKGGFSIDYFSNPGELLYTLAIAIPHLSSNLQSQAKTYIQQEYQNFSPSQYDHIGWRDGAAREPYSLPPEVESGRSSFGPEGSMDVFSFYGLWKYAQVVGGASQIFGQVKNKLPSPLSDAELREKPHIHNKFIAGYVGYLKLQVLAGEPESSSVRNTLDQLLSKRASFFTKDSPYEDTFMSYKRDMNISRNFLYMVPELGDYLFNNARSKVVGAVQEYNKVAPHWFVSKYESSVREGVISPLINYSGLFLAKALALKEPYSEVAKYVDVAGVDKGDLFHIQNLVYALEASGTGPTYPTQSPTPTLPPRDPGDADNDGNVDIDDYIIWISQYLNYNPSPNSDPDFNRDGNVDGEDFVIWLSNHGT